MRDLPTAAASGILDEVMRVKMRLAAAHIPHDAFQITLIGRGIKGVCGQFKRNAFFPGAGLEKDGDGRVQAGGAAVSTM